MLGFVVTETPLALMAPAWISPSTCDSEKSADPTVMLPPPPEEPVLPPPPPAGAVGLLLAPHAARASAAIAVAPVMRIVRFIRVLLSGRRHGRWERRVPRRCHGPWWRQPAGCPRCS